MEDQFEAEVVATVGIVGPGDMGHNVGRAIQEQAGLRVVTALGGRSETSRERAASAGMEDLGNLHHLVSEADLILSIMPPGAAPGFAEAVSATLHEIGASTPFAECNPLAPETVCDIATTFEPAVPFVDAGIVGPPPGTAEAATRFYVCGPHADLMEAIACDDIEVRHTGDELGTASALKICYAALNKGAMTLRAAVLVAAKQLGVSEVFHAEVAASQPAHWNAMTKVIPWYAKDAVRQCDEMVEIQKTFTAAGVTAGFHKGAEELYELLARTPLIDETRETEDRERSLEEAVRIFAAAIRL